jgi:hypothetical protein
MRSTAAAVMALRASSMVVVEEEEVVVVEDMDFADSEKLRGFISISETPTIGF